MNIVIIIDEISSQSLCKMLEVIFENQITIFDTDKININVSNSDSFFMNIIEDIFHEEYSTEDEYLYNLIKKEFVSPLYISVEANSITLLKRLCIELNKRSIKYLVDLSA